MPLTRILVADDHSVVRRGLRALLETQQEWSICGEAATGSEAILKAKRLKPDVIVMDISMPEVNGLEATRQIHEEMPDTPVLILSMHDSDQLVRDVLAAGARGYVLKSDLDRNLFSAIRALREGKTFFSAKVSEIVLDGFLKTHAARPGGTTPPSPELTPRQKEIVRLLAEGKINKEVADALGIATKTVEAHRAQIMHKLGLRSFSDLVRYAVREKLVEV
jgi:DNA-binding NarL/FixJ family response regulator